MILVRAQLTIKAEERGAFLDHLRTFVKISRTEEGCLSFNCYEDVDSPNAFTVLEEWRDQHSFDRHEHSSHLAQLKAQIGKMIISREATRVYRADLQTL